MGQKPKGGGVGEGTGGALGNAGGPSGVYSGGAELGRPAVQRARWLGVGPIHPAGPGVARADGALPAAGGTGGAVQAVAVELVVEGAKADAEDLRRPRLRREPGQGLLDEPPLHLVDAAEVESPSALAA